MPRPEGESSPSLARLAVDEISGALDLLANPERAVQEKRYLKSALRHIGVSVPALHREAKQFLSGHPGLSRIELLALVEELWARGIHEHRMVACELLDLRSRLLGAADFGFVERLLRDSKTWAVVDSLSINVAGALLQRFPELGAETDRWAKDGDFWVRRAALLALLPALRQGRGDFGRFGRYADSMLEEKEFFIRKAIGWVLRDSGKKSPEQVAAWLLPRVGRASGVTVREAVKYLPPGLQQEIEVARARSVPGRIRAR